MRSRPLPIGEIAFERGFSIRRFLWWWRLLDRGLVNVRAVRHG